MTEQSTPRCGTKFAPPGWYCSRAEHGPNSPCALHPNHPEEENPGSLGANVELRANLRKLLNAPESTPWKARTINVELAVAAVNALPDLLGQIDSQASLVAWLDRKYREIDQKYSALCEFVRNLSRRESTWQEDDKYEPCLVADAILSNPPAFLCRAYETGWVIEVPAFGFAASPNGTKPAISDVPPDESGRSFLSENPEVSTNFLTQNPKNALYFSTAANANAALELAAARANGDSSSVVRSGYAVVDGKTVQIVLNGKTFAAEVLNVAFGPPPEGNPGSIPVKENIKGDPPLSPEAADLVLSLRESEAEMLKMINELRADNDRLAGKLQTAEARVEDLKSKFEIGVQTAIDLGRENAALQERLKDLVEWRDRAPTENALRTKLAEAEKALADFKADHAEMSAALEHKSQLLDDLKRESREEYDDLRRVHRMAMRTSYDAAFDRAKQAERLRKEVQIEAEAARAAIAERDELSKIVDFHRNAIASELRSEPARDAATQHEKHFTEGYRAYAVDGDPPYSPGSARDDSWKAGFAQAADDFKAKTADLVAARDELSATLAARDRARAAAKSLAGLTIVNTESDYIEWLESRNEELATFEAQVATLKAENERAAQEARKALSEAETKLLHALDVLHYPKSRKLIADLVDGRRFEKIDHTVVRGTCLTILEMDVEAKRRAFDIALLPILATLFYSKFAPGAGFIYKAEADRIYDLLKDAFSPDHGWVDPNSP